ncbi:DotU family type IV/VI secretion system protein [Thalassomonas haliotis]|nr:DotU family type IV/VI secretion system protein [Thalassomonas haliotis]
MKAEAINLVALMSQFYQQIATIKIWIREGQLNNEVMAILKLDKVPSDSETASAISLLLGQWIDRKQLEYRYTLTDRELYMLDKACFAMVSLADELLIMELDWPGKEHWHQVLLEQQHYQSCSAGEVLYQHMDELLSDGNYDDLERQLAALYLLVLRLGFLGLYRDDEEQQAYYRKKLFNIVNRGQSDESVAISKEAYQQQLISEQEQRLAPLANWYRAITFGLLFYLIFGGGLWYSLTWSLNQWMGG